MIAPAPADVLARIVARRRERFGLRPGERLRPQVPRGAAAEARPSPFLAALAGRRGRAVIAEVKLGSPRLGRLAGVDPERQAAAYAAHGAAALSVVVEPDFFFAAPDLLARCVAASGLPALAKDFLVHPDQLAAARDAGAAAVLLVAALFDAGELAAWAAAARAMGMTPLVEVHDDADLDRLAAAGETWELVGVNNRDLRTFTVSLAASIALRPRLPAGALAVAESGIATRADVERLAAAGFDAFLVGESLLTAADPGTALRDLLA